MVVERRKHITPEKRAEHPIATLAVGIAGSKGRLQTKEGKQEVKSVEEGVRNRAQEKEKRGLGGGYIITFNLEGIRKLFTFVRK